MQRDLAADHRATLALLVSFAMEGAILYAGHAKLHGGAIPLIRRMAITSFTDLIWRYRLE